MGYDNILFIAFHDVTFPVVKPPVRKAELPSPPSVEMKNPWIYIFPLPCVSLSCCRVKHWEKFAFTLRNIIMVIKLVESGWWSVETGVSEMLLTFSQKTLKENIPWENMS